MATMKYVAKADSFAGRLSDGQVIIVEGWLLPPADKIKAPEKFSPEYWADKVDGESVRIDPHSDSDNWDGVI